MGVGYILVNIDKKQQIGFYNIDTGTKLRELSGTVIASTIVTYYLSTNTGDRIGFINDTDDGVVVCGQSYKWEFFKDFVDVTDQIVEELIEKEIIRDNGIIWIDKEDNLFYRDLINIWDPRITK
jgi:bifunctional DNA-binding transcriptional regulator/antitoxin component of YhaV-PrlF toxin-antitoxin module